MANNLFADVPAACVALQTIDFAGAGFDETNTRIIYEVGSPLKSWVPGRSINAVTGFTSDKGYYIVPKADMDMETYLAPPIPAGTGGGGGGDTPTYLVLTSAGSPNTITETPTGTWTAPGSGNGEGVATTESLAPSANGHIQAQYIGTSNVGAVIGLDAVNSITDFDAFDYGLYVAAGTYWKVVGGTATDTSVAASAGHYYRVARSGGDTIKAEYSSDGTTWTTIHTFVATTTAELFPKIAVVVIGNKASEVKGLGLS